MVVVGMVVVGMVVVGMVVPVVVAMAIGTRQRCFVVMGA
jgi:hypothetical protein